MINLPTFTMFVGLPGVGKSFEAQKLLHNNSNTNAALEVMRSCQVEVV